MWRIFYYRRVGRYNGYWLYLDVERDRQLRAHCLELWSRGVEYYYRQRVPMPY